MQDSTAPVLEDVIKEIGQFNSTHKPVDQMLNRDGKDHELPPAVKMTVNRGNMQPAGSGVKNDTSQGRKISEAWSKQHLGQQKFRKSSASKNDHKRLQNATKDAHHPTEYSRHMAKYISNNGIPLEHINYCDSKKTERIMRWLNEVNDETKVYEKIHGKWHTSLRESSRR